MGDIMRTAGNIRKIYVPMALYKPGDGSIIGEEDGIMPCYYDKEQAIKCHPGAEVIEVTIDHGNWGMNGSGIWFMGADSE